MAVSVAAYNTSTYSNTGPTVSATWTPLENDQLVVFLSCTNTFAPQALSGWSDLGSGNITPGDSSTSAIGLIHTVTADEASAVTTSYSMAGLFAGSETGRWWLVVLRGVDPVDPIDGIGIWAEANTPSTHQLAAISGGGSGVGSVSNLKRQTFNLGSEGVTISTANSGTSGDSLSNVIQSGSGAGVYESAAGLRGEAGAHVSGVLNDNFTMELSNNSATSGTAQVYFRILEYPTTGGAFFRLRSSAGNVAIFNLTSSGVLILQNSAGTGLKNFMSNTPLSTNTIYRVQLQATPNASTTAGYIAGQLYDDDDNLLDSYSSSAVNAGTTLNVQTAQVGKVVTGSEGFNMQFDEFGFGTGTTAQIDPVSKNTLSNNSFVLRQVSSDGTGTTYTTPSGHTALMAAAGSGGWVGYRDALTSAGVTVAAQDITVSTADEGVGISVAFRVAGAAVANVHIKASGTFGDGLAKVKISGSFTDATVKTKSGGSWT